MLIENIKSNWETDILGYAQVIPSLKGTDYPAWTVKLVDGYGVAIPYSGEDINESFSNARIFPFLPLLDYIFYLTCKSLL